MTKAVDAIGAELRAQSILPLDTAGGSLNHAGPGRNWSGQIYVATPALLRAFGIRASEIDPDADFLSMRPGLSGTSDMQFLYGKYAPANYGPGGQGQGPGRNSYPCPKGSCLANPVIQEVSVLPSGTSAPNTVITEHAIAERVEMGPRRDSRPDPTPRRNRRPGRRRRRTGRYGRRRRPRCGGRRRRRRRASRADPARGHRRGRRHSRRAGRTPRSRRTGRSCAAKNRRARRLGTWSVKIHHSARPRKKSTRRSRAILMSCMGCAGKLSKAKGALPPILQLALPAKGTAFEIRSLWGSKGEPLAGCPGQSPWPSFSFIAA